MKKAIICISTASRGELISFNNKLEQRHVAVCGVTSQETAEVDIKYVFPDAEWCGWRYFATMKEWNLPFSQYYYEKVIGNQRATALPLSDRYGPIGGGFVEAENRMMIDFSRAHALIEHNSPDLIIFARSIPEPPIEYCIYEIAKTQGIRILIANTVGSLTHLRVVTTEMNSAYLDSQLRSSPSLVDVNMGNEGSRILSKQSRDFVTRVKNEGESYYPSYMLGKRSKDYGAPILDYFKKILFEIKKSCKLKSVSKHLSMHSGALFVFLLRRKYRKLSLSKSSLALKKFNVFFPLHYQPEISSAPGGDVFANQIRALKILSEGLPDDAAIFVKDHPAQFSMYLKSTSNQRPAGFYRYIMAIPKVQLVALDVHAAYMHKICDVTAVINGSAGFESLLRGTPVIAFGTPFFLNCDGVYRVHNRRTVRKAVSEVKLKPAVNQESVESFLIGLEQFSLTWEAISELGFSDDSSKAVFGMGAILLAIDIINDRSHPHYGDHPLVE
jgi:hypothetical protein